MTPFKSTCVHCTKEIDHVLVRQTSYDRATFTTNEKGDYILGEIYEVGECDPTPPMTCPECFEELE